MHWKLWMVCLGLCLFACSYDEIERDPGDLECLTEYSYEKNIQFIIQDNCAYSGCHNGASAAPGNFVDFDGLKSRIDNGSFAERVIDFRDMPPQDGDPSELSEEDLNAIRCWAEQGYPEN